MSRLGALHAEPAAASPPAAGDASAFAEQVRPLQASAPPSTRFVFVTATIPDYVFSDLELDFPGIVAAFGPGLHRTAPGSLGLGIGVLGYCRAACHAHCGHRMAVVRALSCGGRGETRQRLRSPAAAQCCRLPWGTLQKLGRRPLRRPPGPYGTQGVPAPLAAWPAL